MTEKDYGGQTKYGREGKSVKNIQIAPNTKIEKREKLNSNMESLDEDMNIEKIKQAGKIASDVKKWIKPLIKKDMLLLELAEKIENKIIGLGGKSAFPCNLSIDEIAAHYTPSYNDETKASGLLKIDFGVHIDGWCSDTAFSVDLENNDENKKLIKASEDALKKATERIKLGTYSNEIGEVVQNEIESSGFLPIINLFGHQIDHYDLHSGITIPNTKQGTRDEIEEGLYAIEPFATSGKGKVADGTNSGIYQLMTNKNVRSPKARDILDFIIEEYETLPFCSRWLVNKFGTAALIYLRELENNGNLHQFARLVEISKSKVAQTENTILITKNEKVVTTE